MREDTTEIINKNEFRFVGLSRSGNHAIINWIIGQTWGNYCFLNCAEPKFNPFESARPLKQGGTVYQTNIPTFSLESEKEGAFVKKDFLIYSYEDCFLGPLSSQRFSKKHLAWTGASSYIKDILILRDPFNLFASRIKANLIHGHYSHGARPISTLTLRRIYKQHAKEFLGRGKRNLPNLLPVSFNRWATDKPYRKSLVEELHLEFTDKDFKEVHEVAGGSSFDGVAYSGAAHQMKVNDRWEKYASEESFWELFDAEMVELAIEIFGEIEPAIYYQKNFL